MQDLIVSTPRGIYCAAGDFYIDPWQPVSRAIITHAHGDHLRGGSAHYIVADAGAAVARHRLPEGASLQAVAYGERMRFGATTVSLHPAGHILGSAQVRIEHESAIWVVSGDYKRDADPTCDPFEVVPCDVFISEATFALPVYRWTPTPSSLARYMPGGTTTATGACRASCSPTPSARRSAFSPNSRN